VPEVEVICCKTQPVFFGIPDTSMPAKRSYTCTSKIHKSTRKSYSVKQTLNSLVHPEHSTSIPTLGKGIPAHTMKVYRRIGGTAPFILNLWTNWKWVFSVMPWPLYHLPTKERDPSIHSSWNFIFSTKVIRKFVSQCTKYMGV
jgi:hypothetical protein